MAGYKIGRITSDIKVTLSELFREIKDPRVGFVTVTRVSVTPDLRSAKVFVSLMGTEDEMASSWLGLNRALGFLRREVGRRVRLRYTPELSLAIDDTMAYSARIQKLLREISAED